MNPILQQIEDTVDGIVESPESKDQYDRIVIAGKKIMFDEASHDQISWMKEGTDLAGVVTGVADMISILNDMSKGTMQKEPAHGAAITLTMEALDFKERAQGFEITQELANTALGAIDEHMKAGYAKDEPPVGVEPTPMAQSALTEPQPVARPPAAPQGLINAGRTL